MDPERLINGVIMKSLVLLSFLAVPGFACDSLLGSWLCTYNNDSEYVTISKQDSNFVIQDANFSFVTGGKNTFQAGSYEAQCINNALIIKMDLDFGGNMSRLDHVFFKSEFGIKFYTSNLDTRESAVIDCSQVQ
jgi:hypothetical protein